MLGDIVTVLVERPMGSHHPDYPETVYPVNYGYVGGILGGDGEEQDAYILGVEGPLASFSGRVVAVIHRRDDVEEKWVVAPEGVTFTEEEIRRATDFQERYFDIEIEL